MSTDYCSRSPIYIGDLIDGRLKNVRMHKREDGALSLTDGWNFLWVYFNAEGLVTFFTRYAPNGDPRGILREISETLDVEIVSEHEPQFWGFETEEEWEAAQEATYEEWKAAEKARAEEFYHEAMKFVRGENNNIKQGTIEMDKAEIANRLVTKSPHLLAPDRRQELIEAIETIHRWEEQLRDIQEGNILF